MTDFGMNRLFLFLFLSIHFFLLLQRAVPAAPIMPISIRLIQRAILLRNKKLRAKQD